MRAFIWAPALALITATTASAISVRVTVENLQPANGVAITPLWVGFHNGSFDSYDNGLTSQPGLERIAEDGDVMQIAADFNNGFTYVSGGVSQTVASGQAGADRVGGVLASPSGLPPLSPGESATELFSIDIDGSNRYFSYAAMVIPTNDFFIANGNPLAHDLMSLYDGEGTISFFVGAPGTVDDAGTEEEDLAFSAGNPLFPGRNLPAGQGGANSGPADSSNLITPVVGDPFAGFLNAAGVDLSGFNFNAATGGGIARLTITAVPEPATAAVMAIGAVAVIGLRRKK